MNREIVIVRYLRGALTIVVYGILLFTIRSGCLPRTNDQAISAAALTIFP